MRILVTGAEGFLGRNLSVRLGEAGHDVVGFTRSHAVEELQAKLFGVEAVFHLAGENRPKIEADFQKGNVGLTQAIADAIRESGQTPRVIFASSTQATLDNPYGRSKRDAEGVLEQLALQTGCAVSIFRLPGVFGKWGRANYNSVVHTFCHNLARGLPVDVRDPGHELMLVYVDDVVSAFLSQLSAAADGVSRPQVKPHYAVTLGSLKAQIEAFDACRNSLVVERVGTGFARALYATYVSYMPSDGFAYSVPAHTEARGSFVEVLKTHDSGQFSFFTAKPGVTRGGHYHHTKTEKFLVLSGQATFRFRHLLTDERLSIDTSGETPQIVETVPGWVHDITNSGPDDLIVMLWANEQFDPQQPDTIASGV